MKNYSKFVLTVKKNNNDNDHDNITVYYSSYLRSACLFEKTYLHTSQVQITLTGCMDGILTLTIQKIIFKT